MRSNWLLTGVAASAAFLGGFLAGCQTYDFEPVEPLSIGKEEVIADITARVLPPNLMLLLDKSDSMDRPEDPSVSGCRVDGDVCGSNPLCNESICPTRLSRAREALSQFLSPQASTYPFRVGLTAYPLDGQCLPASRTFIGLPDSEITTDLAPQAVQVRSYIQSLVSEDGDLENFNYDIETAGGTPTAESLRYLLNSVPKLKDKTGGRDNFVLLITDGLPNCNYDHPPYTRADDPNNPCRCALVDPTQCDGNPQGCLDDNNTVAAINELHAAGVKTIVVGLGADTATGLGPETLQAMGAAGRFERTCRSDSECGEGDSCNLSATPAVCNKSYYQASNGAALAAALREIAERIPAGDPCRVKFTSQPSDPSLIFVRVDGEQIPSNGGANWVFDDQGLLFQGQICERIEASTPDKPVKVKVSVIQSQ